MFYVGFKRVVLDSVLMSIMISGLIIIAACGLFETVVTLFAVSSGLFYAHSIVQRLNKTVPYFFYWFIISILHTLISYEFIVSNLLLMKPEENFLFLSFISLAFSCLIFTKYLSSQSNLSSETSRGEPLLLSDLKDPENGEKKCPNLDADSCPLFGMLPFCTSLRCWLCRISAPSKQQYCLWLDCQISLRNFDFYVFGLSFLTVSLIFYTYLILTSACHCNLLWSIFGIDLYYPDDCSDVYDDSDVAICFASGLYALLPALITAYTLIADLSSFVLAPSGTINRLNGNHIRPF